MLFEGLVLLYVILFEAKVSKNLLILNEQNYKKINICNLQVHFKAS